MTTDIFIKTYHKDFMWLRWCLMSIKKFSSGFRDVVVVTDSGYTIPSEFLKIIPLKIFYVDLPTKKPSVVEHGLGYLWQQYIKLSWYEYTDADEVLILDSDEMLTVVTTPDSFKIDDKYAWYFKLWDEMGDGKCWKKTTDELFGVDTEYSGMCITGFIMLKSTSIALKNHLCAKHECSSIWDIFVKYDMKTASEFNVFGVFIMLFDQQEYNQIILNNNYHVRPFNHTILKDWSWGGLTVENISRRQKILHPIVHVDSD